MAKYFFLVTLLLGVYNAASTETTAVERSVPHIDPQIIPPPLRSPLGYTYRVVNYLTAPEIIDEVVNTLEKVANTASDDKIIDQLKPLTNKLLKHITNISSDAITDHELTEAMESAEHLFNKSAEAMESWGFLGKNQYYVKSLTKKALQALDALREAATEASYLNIDLGSIVELFTRVLASTGGGDSFRKQETTRNDLPDIFARLFLNSKKAGRDETSDGDELSLSSLRDLLPKQFSLDSVLKAIATVADSAAADDDGHEYHLDEKHIQETLHRLFAYTD